MNYILYNCISIIYIDYGVSYWTDKVDRFTTYQAAMVVRMADHQNIQTRERQPMVSKQMDQVEVAVEVH